MTRTIVVRTKLTYTRRKCNAAAVSQSAERAALDQINGASSVREHRAASMRAASLACASAGCLCALTVVEVADARMVVLREQRHGLSSASRGSGDGAQSQRKEDARQASKGEGSSKGSSSDSRC